MDEKWFAHNGKIYKEGTIIKIKHGDKIQEATFLWHDIERNNYIYQTFTNNCYCLHTKHKDVFYANLIDVTCNIDSHYTAPDRRAKWTYRKELEINGMLLAWMWYVFIMFISVLFYDRIWIWIFTSIIFWNYRDKQLRKVGYK